MKCWCSMKTSITDPFPHLDRAGACRTQSGPSRRIGSATTHRSVMSSGCSGRVKASSSLTAGRAMPFAANPARKAPARRESAQESYGEPLLVEERDAKLAVAMPTIATPTIATTLRGCISGADRLSQRFCRPGRASVAALHQWGRAATFWHVRAPVRRYTGQQRSRKMPAVFVFLAKSTLCPQFFRHDVNKGWG